jgi:hypothetical protein
MRINRFVLLIAALLTSIFVWFKLSAIEHDKYAPLMLNQVRFSGQIVSLNPSRNHRFGIVGIKLQSTNSDKIAKTKDSILFPYRIEDHYAEVYCYVPYIARIGDSIKLDSDKRLLEVLRNDSVIDSARVDINFDRTNIDFVNRNTKFK